MKWDATTSADIQTLEEQLGRVPRGVIGVGARCVCGRPLVVVTAPRLEDGTPFPTTFYLTSPAAVKGASTLEATGVMEDMNAQLADDEKLRADYARAHANYLAERAALGEVPEIDGISAGGMPERVKCLHAVLGHALSVGPGVNPLGDETLRLLTERGAFSLARCFC